MADQELPTSPLENQMIQEAKENLAKQKAQQTEVKAEPTNIEPQNITPEVESKPSPQESWRYMREELDRARELAEKERREKEYILSQIRESQAKSQEPEIIDPTFAGKDFIEGTDLEKQQQTYNLKLQRESKKREELEQRMMDMIVDNRLMQEHPDIQTILSDANVKRLRELKPDLAKSILYNTDRYSQHKAAIDAVKAFVLTDKNDAKREAKEAQRIEKNLSKPLPTTSSASPLTQATAFAEKNLTSDEKSELYKSWVQKTHGSYYNFKK